MAYDEITPGYYWMKGPNFPEWEPVRVRLSAVGDRRVVDAFDFDFDLPLEGLVDTGHQFIPILPPEAGAEYEKKGMSPAAKAVDTEQSDREYIAKKQKKEKE